MEFVVAIVDGAFSVVVIIIEIFIQVFSMNFNCYASAYFEIISNKNEKWIRDMQLITPI